MESLLASYGSDEEDADSPPVSPARSGQTSVSLPPSTNRQFIFGSLPPPRISAPEISLWDDEDEPLERNSGGGPGKREHMTIAAPFTSLPPPKNSAPEKSDYGESVRKGAGDGEQRMIGNRESKKGGSSLFGALPPPRFDSINLPSGFFDDPMAISISEAQRADEETPKGSTGKLSSLFAKLPPPRSSDSLFASLPLASSSRIGAEKPRKKVVEFRPPVNMAALETLEEDEMVRSKKRFKVSEESVKPKAGGLTALLPPPKNSLGAGAALGGGGGHGGRRPVMETLSNSYNAGHEENPNSSNITPTLESRKLQNAQGNVGHPSQGVSSNGYASEPIDHSSEGTYYARDSSSHEDPQMRNSEEQYAQKETGRGDGYFAGNEHDRVNWQYAGASAFGVGSIPSEGQGHAPAHTLVETLQERRKGREEFPAQLIEIKQADLTGGSKVREDQLRTTGIAFGPAYKPVASNKDKPSKLHRRKHQIGALYFDMKQNEMNLLDRRSKGNLTKAETQAKYGW